MMSFNPFSLSGKTILVTGASSGIGREIAVTCSRMGARIVACGRNLSKLESTLAALAGNDNMIMSADLTNQDEINNLASSVSSLDGIVHCAGIGYRVPTKIIQESDLVNVMKVNFGGAVLLQAALQAKKKINKNASIVFIASKAVDSPSPGNSLYSASKGAIVSYSKCLAVELAPRGIRVNCILPAMIWTDLILQDSITQEQLKKSQENYLLKRYGKPEDVAYLSVYLLSDASSWMTNSCIEITGGGQ